MVCNTTEQRIGSNISISSLYIPFLRNTHPHGFKCYAAKDSLPLHFSPQPAPTSPSPLNSKSLQQRLSSYNLPPTSPLVDLTHFSKWDSRFPAPTPNLTSAAVPSLPSCSGQKAENHILPTLSLAPCHHIQPMMLPQYILSWPRPPAFLA